MTFILFLLWQNRVSSQWTAEEKGGVDPWCHAFTLTYFVASPDGGCCCFPLGAIVKVAFHPGLGVSWGHVCAWSTQPPLCLVQKNKRRPAYFSKKKKFAFCAIKGLSIQTGVLPQDDLKGVGIREDSSTEIVLFCFFHNICHDCRWATWSKRVFCIGQRSHGSSSAVPTTVPLRTSVAQTHHPADWTRSINHHAGKHVHQGS